MKIIFTLPYNRSQSWVVATVCDLPDPTSLLLPQTIDAISLGHGLDRWNKAKPGHSESLRNRY